VGLILARLTQLDRGFVLELAVIHKLRNWRLCHRRNLDEVEIGLLSKAQRIIDPHDPDLLTIGSD
jgi:hypothetical protein